MKLWTSHWGKNFLFSTFILACGLVQLERSIRRDDAFHLTLNVLLALLFAAMSVTAFILYRQEATPPRDDKTP